MKPNSISLLYLSSLLCLGHSNNIISSQSQQPQYLNKYTTNVYPYMQLSLTQWRTTMEKSFLSSQDDIGTWNVSSDSNTTCILLKGIIKLTINYTDINNHTKLSNIDVPPSATASGSCNEIGQYIILSWQPTNNSSLPESLNNTLTIVFESNEKSRKLAGTPNTIPSGKFAIVKVSAVIHKNENVFPNATNPSVPFIIERNGLVMFPTTLNHSFSCDAVITIGSPKEPLTVLLQNSQIEAFRRVANRVKPDGGNFSAAEHCAADEISSGSVIVTVIISILSIVLIALGVAAVATYVLKRRRAAMATGYENM